MPSPGIIVRLRPRRGGRLRQFRNAVRSTHTPPLCRRPFCNVAGVMVGESAHGVPKLPQTVPAPGPHDHARQRHGEGRRVYSSLILPPIDCELMPCGIHSYSKGDRQIETLNVPWRTGGQMGDDKLQPPMESAMKRAGVGDVMKLYQGRAEGVNGNAAALRTQYSRGALVTSNSTG